MAALIRKLAPGASLWRHMAERPQNLRPAQQPVLHVVSARSRRSARCPLAASGAGWRRLGLSAGRAMAHRRLVARREAMITAPCELRALIEAVHGDGPRRCRFWKCAEQRHRRGCSSSAGDRMVISLRATWARRGRTTPAIRPGWAARPGRWRWLAGRMGCCAMVAVVLTKSGEPGGSRRTRRGWIACPCRIKRRLSRSPPPHATGRSGAGRW